VATHNKVDGLADLPQDADAALTAVAENYDSVSLSTDR